ncbi:hypothetical protein KOR34_05050 [Posidoniimonas corsicana]|uniref:CRISPR-associated exonuclease Cas4 n=1 Tax=Posidoniimonas corsicana TaxID=1938618 RepID=A0A5C5VBF2_9BACT|nr:CRISPR-associated protein Cas4 [Posidoniimonas corsicana]TWT35611.1 hypothetical protein KOR34_05050 [Posidoniimonas corsicana]
MPHPESDLLPISALQHLLFCERQCALIHVERVWAENRFTAEGQVLHRKAHDGKPETRDGERIARGLPLRSLVLGVSGVADIVLYRPPTGARVSRGSLASRLRRASQDELAEWVVTPVEYKRGKPKKNDSDRVQLCAQAICLEEMHGVTISEGALYYGRLRKRYPVPFDTDLRSSTLSAADRLRDLLYRGVTPPAVREKKCETCSLLPLCLPESMRRRSARAFIDRQLERAAEAES